MEEELCSQVKEAEVDSLEGVDEEVLPEGAEELAESLETAEVVEDFVARALIQLERHLALTAEELAVDFLHALSVAADGVLGSGEDMDGEELGGRIEPTGRIRGDITAKQVTQSGGGKGEAAERVADVLIDLLVEGGEPIELGTGGMDLPVIQLIHQESDLGVARKQPEPEDVPLDTLFRELGDGVLCRKSGEKLRDC